MDNQKSQINIAVVLAIALGIPAVGLGAFFAIRSLWTSPAPPASTSGQQGNAHPQRPGGLPANLFGEIKPSAEPVRSSYDSTPEPVNTTARDFDTALETYKDSLLFLGSQFRDTVNTEWDGFLLPNSSYGKLAVQWTQVFDPDNKPIMSHDKKGDKIQEARLKFFSGQYTLHLIDDKAVAASAIGRMKITVPITWTHFSFSKDQIGQTKRSGPLAAVLQQCQNDYYRLDLTGDIAGKEIVHYARGATGQRLASNSSRKAGNTIFAKVKGQVSQIELFLCQEQHTAQADIVARTEPKIENSHQKIDPPIAAPRYVPTGIKWNFAAMAEEQLIQRVQILSLRSEAMFGYNDPKIRVCLPPVANSWFATISFGNEDSRKRIPCDSSGRPVPCKVEYGVFGDAGGGIGNEIRFRSPKYPAKDSKQVSFHRARGKIRIRYPTEIRCVVLTRDNPQSGTIRANFKGCEVAIQGWDWPGKTFPKSDYSPIRAYDQTGNRLKGVVFERQLYLGAPVRVELVHVAKWIDVTIPYDLTPAPLLPPFGS